MNALAENLPTIAEPNLGDAQLYMIVDCAADSRIYPQLMASNRAYRCLFDGEKTPEALRSVAPYLIKVKANDELVKWCCEEGRHRHWFILFVGPNLSLRQLGRQFKRLAFIRTPEGTRLFFRYYDPRVLPSFLTSCTVAERDSIFKELHCFIVPTQPTRRKSVLLKHYDKQGGVNTLPPSFLWSGTSHNKPTSPLQVHKE